MTAETGASTSRGLPTTTKSYRRGARIMFSIVALRGTSPTNTRISDSST